MNMGVPAQLNSVVSGWPYRDGGPLDVVALHQQVSVPVAQLLGHRLIHIWEPVQEVPAAFRQHVYTSAVAFMLLPYADTASRG